LKLEVLTKLLICLFCLNEFNLASFLQLFLDDARIKNFTSCFKEKKFLHFFFTRLKQNDTGKYEKDFPYFSPCGREKNFVRCDDLPIVFTHVHEVLEKNGETKDYLSYNHAGDLLLVNFEPNKLFMLPQTGRVYHPANEQYGGVGLVKSSLAIEFSKNIEFCDEESEEYGKPTHFTWKGLRYELSNEILKLLSEKQFSQLHY
ncbi:UPF0598 protein CG30010-like, partial [Limulus polyphemus]|uniref:UPF0598 protein CG30010-like n=1 Tax=Limulus polyphemus TaxID=6850 RepID=A0ABM1BLU0_LIMPO